MDGVKRYTYEVDDGVFAECVLGEDFDAALTRESVLEELASERNRFMATVDKLAKQLAAAEQRDAALSAMVFRLASKGSEVPGFPASLMREARLLIKPTESVAYQSREIGESDWADCTKAEYDHCGKDPHMDTRIKPTESGASE